MRRALLPISILLYCLTGASSAIAAGGHVTSGPCPFSCKSMGISKKVCRDWRNGNTCYVEDLRDQGSERERKPQNQPEQSRPLPVTAGGKGHVTISPCPHSCQTRGIPKHVCRDWREGNACYVEDLTRPPGFTDNMPSRPVPLPRPVDIGNRPFDNGGVAVPSECDHGHRLSRPRIDIYSIKKTGNFFKDKYKVRGAVEGVCIVEAGYFENGRLEDRIPTVKIPTFRRYEFEVVAEGDERPEIRVYNANGDREVYDIDSREYDDRDYYRHDRHDDHDHGDHHRRNW